MPSPFKDDLFLPIQCHMGTTAPSYVTEEIKERAMGRGCAMRPIGDIPDDELEAEMKRRQEAKETIYGRNIWEWVREKQGD